MVLRLACLRDNSIRATVQWARHAVRTKVRKIRRGCCHAGRLHRRWQQKRASGYIVAKRFKRLAENLKIDQEAWQHRRRLAQLTRLRRGVLLNFDLGGKTARRIKKR